MFSFPESYFRLVGLFDWGYARTQILLSVSWNRYIFTLAGYRNEKSATEPALQATELLNNKYIICHFLGCKWKISLSGCWLVL